MHSSGAGEALLRFAEKVAAPIATTTMGKGAIPETHPLAMGVVGNLTGPGGLGRQTKPLLQHADLVLLIGNRTNEDGTDRWSLIPAARACSISTSIRRRSVVITRRCVCLAI